MSDTRLPLDSDARDLLLLVQDGFTRTRAICDVLGIKNAYAVSPSMKALKANGFLTNRYEPDGTTAIWALTDLAREALGG